ncbi:YdcH family protein [Grimontia sp. NTOU-MAR1]|uniref:YdcH family protein n=1 Tax=Grimontia sp. NTOU-MAR1 TaxID=3111011 RepID=UPI002DB80D51|nr:YdcH family protein [Grimontia sp. NTOU-MAR1]WRW00962.1 YdcH family protein [Grimontia sp. NTOU-MAR1]
MLGEVHSLVHEFPDFKDLITELSTQDTAFAEDNKKYNALDKEIRSLELRDSPIDDEEMHKLKHDRAVLKDSLYHRLQQAS